MDLGGQFYLHLALLPPNLSVALEPSWEEPYNYQISFRPNWIWRDAVDVDVMTPAVGEIPEVAEENTTAFGIPKFARFKMLKSSARNCRVTFSESAVFLIADRSSSATPGPMSVSRPTLP